MCIRQLSLLLPLTVALIATPVCSTAGTPRRQLRKAQPAVTPNATLVLLANNTFGAKCLDGSPPGYYFRPGAATGRLRWHIYLPGGAWCVTPADCAARAGTRLGSSKSFPANPAHYAAQLRPPFEGILSGSAQQNPAMYQWNLVRLIYCDGGGYAGTRGALNVSAAAAVPPNASAAANSTSPSNSTKSTKSTGSTKSSASTTSAIYLDGWNIIQAVIQGAPPARPLHCALRVPPLLSAVHAVSSTSYCHGTSHSPLGPHFPLSLSPLLDLVRPLPSSHLYRFVSPRSSQCCLLSIPWHSNPTLPLSPRLSPCTLYLVLAALPLHILSFSPASPPCLCPSCHADLVQKRDMRSASQILLSGSSAGGQATVNLCDWLASSFPSASTRCLVDSGFFLEPHRTAPPLQPHLPLWYLICSHATSSAPMLPHLPPCYLICPHATSSAPMLPHLPPCYLICPHATSSAPMLPHLLPCYLICPHATSSAPMLPHLPPCYLICPHATSSAPMLPHLPPCYLICPHATSSAPMLPHLPPCYLICPHATSSAPMLPHLPPCYLICPHATSSAPMLPHLPPCYLICPHATSSAPMLPHLPPCYLICPHATSSAPMLPHLPPCYLTCPDPPASPPSPPSPNTAARPAQQWRCFFPQYTLHNTSTPLFLFHTPFDYVAAMIAKHKLAMARQTAVQECGARQPQIDQHRATVDGEQMRVVALLDSLLFISRSDAPMGMWVRLVRYLAEKGVPGFPKKGYGTYYTTYGFDVLEQLNILNRAFQHKEIKRTTSHIESRYVDCGDDFGGGVSKLLSPFIARHGPGGNREVKVEGVDSDGRPARFTFRLHEDELEEFEGRGTHDDCVEVCTEFAEVIVHQLEHRLGDLEGMSGAKLFIPDEYPLDRVERNRRAYKKHKPHSNAPLPPAGKHQNKAKLADEVMEVEDIEEDNDASDSNDDDGFDE
ncbi:unnamed protein product [Closterium sp. Naga37s-1]|nr:unnamed protein product [Closterium sp. Naga37s-1]